MTDDQRRDALPEELVRYAPIIEWRRMRLLWAGDERPDAITIAATARMRAASRMHAALIRRNAIAPDIPF